MLSLERELIRAYRAATEAYIGDPFSEPARLAFLDARDGLAEFIRDDGRPAEDIENGVRYLVTHSGAIRSGPLSSGMFVDWQAYWCDPVAPPYSH